MYRMASAAELPLPRSNTWLSCASLQCIRHGVTIVTCLPGKEGDHGEKTYAFMLRNTDEAV